MSGPINVYWATANDGFDLDWQIMMEEPSSLRKEMFDSRNKSNKTRNTFLKCPASTSVINNIFVWKSPKDTSVDLEIINDEIQLNKYENDNDSDIFKWTVEHQPTLGWNLLVTLKHHIIFFAEEDVDVLFSAPYFSHAPHLQYGAVVPGKFNVGAWFRPFNAEMNLWHGQTHMEFKENEPIAYFTFLTDRKINLKRFRMTEKTRGIARANATSGTWLPYKSLQERYQIFKSRGLRNVILKDIKENLV